MAKSTFEICLIIAERSLGRSVSVGGGGGGGGGPYNQDLIFYSKLKCSPQCSTFYIRVK